MVNQKNSENVIGYINKNGLECCGLHLTLSSGYSVFDPTRNLSLDLCHKKNYLTSLINYQFYKKEIKDQISFAAMSWKITHLDGHLHIQTFPLFYKAIINSMKSNHIGKVRNSFSNLNKDFRVKDRIKQYYRSVMKKNGLIMPDYLFDVAYFLKNVGYVLSLPDRCVIEVVCHPDIAGNSDCELLTSLEYSNVISKFEKISYNEFGKA